MTAIRVLLVDDDQLIRKMLAALLSTLGAEVVGEAENGKQAVLFQSKLNPDVTFLDIQMPVKNGFDALREIKRQDAHADVIMLTASDDTVIAESCINAGARSYIKKGESFEALGPVVEKLLSTVQVRGTLK